MLINLNNHPEEIPTEGISFFGQLMEKVSEKAAEDGGSILNVRINGEDVTGRDRSNLEELPLDDIEKLEVMTGDPKTLARSTLYSIADFLEQLIKELSNTAELFRVDSNGRSNESYLRCIDGLQVFMHTLESARRLLGLSFELLFVPVGNNGEDISIAESRRQIFASLDTMIEAQTDQDWILLADIMEYELIPRMEDWRQIIPMILDKTSHIPFTEPVQEMADSQPVAIG